MLTLDHIILRTASVEATTATLADRVAAPVLAAPERVNGMCSGILRAGPIDAGPAVSGVVVRTSGHLERWRSLPMARGGLLTLQDDGPPGITELTFTGDHRRDSFQLGHVRFSFAGSS